MRIHTVASHLVLRCRVAAAGEEHFAGQQKFAEVVAEFGPAGHGDQPSGGLALAPPAVEQDGEFGRRDLSGGIGRGLEKFIAVGLADPMMTVNTSPAVVFRTIGKIPPTLPVDEADIIFGPKANGDSEILRGLLNAGHQRNRPAWRISGPEHKPTPFPIFAMVAIAGIGDLPDAMPTPGRRG